MDQQEFEKKKYAANYLVEKTEEYLAKIESNVEAISEKRIVARTVAQLSVEVSKILGKLIHEVKTTDADPKEKLGKAIEVINSLTTSLESTAKANVEEVAKLEATQDGMRRALQAIREDGKLQVAELTRIELLSNEELDDTRRSIGERPEKISVKRNASSLRKSRESENS